MRSKIVHEAGNCGISSISANRRTMIAGAMASIAIPAVALGRQDESLHGVLKAQLRSGKIPGMAVGIARQGKVLFTQGYGFADLSAAVA